MDKQLIENLLNKAQIKASEFIKFNNYCGSPYHVVQKGQNYLKQKGFQELKENEAWNLSPNGKYFLTRGNNSTLVAFVLPDNLKISQFKIIATHTDSPCIRIAPKDQVNQSGYIQANIQLYGGGIWYSWFDRPLSIFGRVVYELNGNLQTKLYESSKSIAKISSMCIHLKDSNPLDIDKEKDLKPIFATQLLSQLQGDSSDEFSPLIKFISEEMSLKPQQIKGFDLCLGDTQNSQIFGLYDEFVSGPRQDNVFSFYSSLEAISDDESPQKNSNEIGICIGFDHEEIGSQTYVGADSDYAKWIMVKILENLNLKEQQDQILRQSFLLSCDMAHAVHPNYSNLHQQSHRPVINQGVVLKINCNGRYTTDSITQGYIKLIGERTKVPIQEFIVSANSRCGSTVGPMLSSRLVCQAADIGAPLLGMHSIRETTGVLDLLYYIELMKGFLRE